MNLVYELKNKPSVPGEHKTLAQDLELIISAKSPNNSQSLGWNLGHICGGLNHGYTTETSF